MNWAHKKLNKNRPAIVCVVCLIIIISEIISGMSSNDMRHLIDYIIAYNQFFYKALGNEIIIFP